MKYVVNLSDIRKGSLPSYSLVMSANCLAYGCCHPHFEYCYWHPERGKCSLLAVVDVAINIIGYNY